MKPLVSVVITCYNYGKYINKCLNSAISQTYPKIEIVIIDDGSTDNTQEIVTPFLEKQNVKYIKQENKGQANAKNTGVRISKGDLIAFLDADDLWEKNKIEKQVDLFKNDSVGVVYCIAKYIDEKGNEINIENTNRYLQPASGNVTKNLLYDNFIPFSSSVVKRECFVKMGGFDESLAMSIDWDLWLKISKEYQFDFVNERLLLYRIGHSGQMSKNLKEREKCSNIILNKYIKKYRDCISESTLNNALFYSYCQRGYYMRRYFISKSIMYYLKAIKLSPLRIVPYNGIIKTILYYLEKQIRFLNQ